MTNSKKYDGQNIKAGQSAARQDTLVTRIFLVRHGQPVQHRAKIFLGQADVPLSEHGKCEASAAGDKLISLSARIKRIYTSDLVRAKETADIISERLGGVPVVPDKLFREMAMGLWDGELIEDIKTKFPEEYAKRGDDLRNYRIPGGENFYDLKGRVTREFNRIFTEDFRSSSGQNTLKNTTYPGNNCTTKTANIGIKSIIDGDPGDLVIVAHLGVITVLSEELGFKAPTDINYRGFVTGSVTMIEAPEWLCRKATHNEN